MHRSLFAQHAAEGPKRRYIGPLIKYAKNEWLMGASKDLISPDKRFVAAMDTLTVGHIKWVGGEPVDHQMGLVADGFHPLHRSELDDLDSKTWEVDEDGSRKDPWQQTTLLVLVAPAPPHDFFTFCTTTVGGGGAIRDLCEAHARTTEAVGQYPVVTLGSDSYHHKDPKKGRVYVPVFEIVDSVEAAPFNALIAETGGGGVFTPTLPPAPDTPVMSAEDIEHPPRLIITNDRRMPPKVPEPPAVDLDDDIPF
jgi:hypothetical protein